MKKFALFATCGAAFAANPAFAQETEMGSLRVEVLGGYDIAKLTIDEEVAGEELSDDEGGIAYGVAVGYDAFFKGAFIGAEVELSDATTGVSETYAGDLQGFDVDGTAALDAGRDLYVGARLGTYIGEGNLFYVKGGYTNASIELTADGTIDGEEVRLEERATLDGIRLGLGAEFRVSGNAYAKVEYRYSGYGDGETEVNGETVDIGEVFQMVDLDRHQLMLGLGMRF